LYSAREHGPWPEALETLAALGYRSVEGYGALLDEQPDLPAMLADHGLHMPVTHVGLDVLESGAARTFAALRALGCEAVFCPYLSPEQRPDDVAGWRTVVRRLHAIGERLKGEGLAFGWHNHDFEFMPLRDGSLPIEVLFDDASELEWEADLAWIQRADADPLIWLERLGERVAAVHVKDIAAPGTADDEDGWADPGAGVMDWPALLAAVQGSGRGASSIHWIAEHDRPSDLARFARRAHAAFGGWWQRLDTSVAGS